MILTRCEHVMAPFVKVMTSDKMHTIRQIIYVFLYLNKVHHYDQKGIAAVAYSGFFSGSNGFLQIIGKVSSLRRKEKIQDRKGILTFPILRPGSMRVGVLFLLTLLVIAPLSPLKAQIVPESEIGDTLGGVILRNEIGGGIQLHNHGFGGSFRRGHQVTAFRKRLWEADLVTMKSPKEVRTVNPYFNNARSYIYGKLNSVMVLRTGLTSHQQLNRKPRDGGVEIRWLYGIGASVALAKPVYLNIIRFTSSTYEYEISTERYDPDQHFVDNIYGRGPFLKGIEKTKLYPGAYGRFGFSFDYSGDHAKVRTLEIGSTLDFYPIPVPVMALNNKEHYFVNFYLSFHFGRKYNRQLSKEELGL